MSGKIYTFKTHRNSNGSLRIYVEGKDIYIVVRDLVRELGFSGKWGQEMVERYSGYETVIKKNVGAKGGEVMLLDIESVYRFINAKRLIDFEKYGSNSAAKYNELELYLKNIVSDISKLSTDVNMSVEKEEQTETRIDLAYKLFFVLLAVQIVLALVGTYVFYNK